MILMAVPFAFLLAGAGRPDEASKYIDEKLGVTDVPPEADDLKATLAEVVGKMLSAGPLNPYYVSRGEGDPEYVFTNPADVVRALSAAIPHLPPALRTKARDYLLKEIARHPPWTDAPLRPEQEAASRNFHPLPSPDPPGRTPIRPGLGNVYALWLYAENTGDWETLRSNYAGIRAFGERHAEEAGISFGAMGGLVGLARIARKLGEGAAAARAAADLEKALSQADLARMTAESTKRAGHGEAWKVDHDFFYGGFHYVDLSPEIARAISDRPGLKRAVVEQTARATLVFPHWFISQASGFMRYYGEGHAITPLLSEMIFPVKAWVEDAPAAKLRMWADAEDAPVGDLYFIKRLAAAIEAHGKRRWVKVGY